MQCHLMADIAVYFVVLRAVKNLYFIGHRHFRKSTAGEEWFTVQFFLDHFQFWWW